MYQQYKTAEHWMMAKKAQLFDPAQVPAILQAGTPAEAKALGRKIVGFSPEIWDSRKYEIVKQGSFLKFSQNDSLRHFLLNTNYRILVEASPVDPIWGIGLSRDHKNCPPPN